MENFKYIEKENYKDNNNTTNFNNSNINININTNINKNKYKNNQEYENENIYNEKKILIILTSGFLGMQISESGKLENHKGFLFNYMKNHQNFCDLNYLKNNYPQEFIENYLLTPPTIQDRRILYKVKELDEIESSSNISLKTWKNIGNCIKDNYVEFDAFIILHGTDTINYTASILSFMLENLNKPVILTGALIPIYKMRNDAQKNIIDSIQIAGNFYIPEVCVVFDSVLYRGNRIIKNDNMHMSAFESPNYSPLGLIGNIIKIKWDVINSPPKEDFTYFDVK
jgi:lysophospholipase